MDLLSILLLLACLCLSVRLHSSDSSDTVENRKHSVNNDKTLKIRHNRKGTSGLKVAVCLTGQISRLEIMSKLRHFVIANILIYNSVDVYINLDDGDVKQSMWDFDYSTNPYKDLNGTELEKVIRDTYHNMVSKYKFKNSDNWNGTQSANASTSHQWRRLTQGLGLMVKIKGPLRSNFSLRGEAPPVTNKTIVINKSDLSKKLNPSSSSSSKGGEEEVRLYISEMDRWQNHMRWMNALRECVMDVQAREIQSRHFYDVIVRVR